MGMKKEGPAIILRMHGFGGFFAGLAARDAPPRAPRWIFRVGDFRTLS
jgi:hypothetical protein